MRGNEPLPGDFGRRESETVHLSGGESAGAMARAEKRRGRCGSWAVEGETTRAMDHCAWLFRRCFVLVQIYTSGDAPAAAERRLETRPRGRSTRFALRAAPGPMPGASVGHPIGSIKDGRLGYEVRKSQRWFTSMELSFH